MSLNIAILGFLYSQPYSGYDLKKVFDQSVRHFWPADQAQIYRTLGKLTKRGLAEMEVVHQEDRPDRKVYHITERGRKELLRWLAAPHAMQDTRSAELIQVFFSGDLSDEQVLKNFERHARQLRSLIDVYTGIPLDPSCTTNDPHDRRRKFYRLLTLECGFFNAKAELAWTESVIERLKNADYTLHLSVEGKEKGGNHE